MRPKVLVVDDEPALVAAITHRLESEGCRTLAASDGEQAIDAAVSQPPDAVLLDVGLPKLDGVEVCRRLKELLEPYTPVILMTARTDLQSKLDGLRSGADEYVTKPVALEEVSARVRGALKLRRLFSRQRSDSIVDALTGAFNRRYLDARLHQECRRAARHRHGFACLMIDLDRFKRINDRYGHACGDQALRAAARTVRALCRESDLLFRYGGDEFILFLPGTTLESAKALAERILERIREIRFLEDVSDRSVLSVLEEGALPSARTVRMSCSIGACAFPAPDVAHARDLLAVLDRSLLEAKKRGRDRTWSCHPAPTRLGTPLRTDLTS
jgi:two-component system, cell cycle response regulator